MITIINRVGKGTRIEREARKMLEDEGYLVDRKNRTKWQSPDFFGMFDLLAIKSDDVRLIQIKSDKSGFYQARTKIKDWLYRYKIKGISFEVWLKENRKDWRKERITLNKNVKRRKNEEDDNEFNRLYG